MSQRGWQAAIVFGLTCFIFGCYATIGFDGHHDGALLKPALDVAKGKVLFRDTFTHYGPLTTLIHALFLKVFGYKLIVLKWATVLFYAVAGTAFFLISARFMPAVLAAFAWFLWLSMAPFLADSTLFIWSSVVALAFQGLALYCLLRGTENPRQLIWMALSGFFTAATFWSRQPVGVFTAGAFAGILALGTLRWRELIPFRGLAAYLTGGALGVGWILAYLVGNGAYGAWHRQNMQWPKVWLRHLLRDDSIFDRALGTFLDSPPYDKLYMVLYLGAFLAGLYGIARFGRQKQWLFIAGLSSLLLGAASYQWLHPITNFAPFMEPIPRLTTAALLVGSLILVIKPKLLRPGVLPMIGLLALATAAWPQYFPLGDGRHQYWGIAPGVFGFVGILYLASNRNLWITWGLLGTFFLIPLWLTWTKAGVFLSTERTRIEEPRILSGVRVQPGLGEYRYIPALVYGDRLIRRFTDRPVLTYNDDAIFAALAENPEMPDPYYVYWGFIGFNKFFRFNLDTRSAFIRERRPIIIMHYYIVKETERILQTMGYQRGLQFKHADVAYLIPDELAEQASVVAQSFLQDFPGSQTKDSP